MGGLIRNFAAKGGLARIDGSDGPGRRPGALVAAVAFSLATLAVVASGPFSPARAAEVADAARATAKLNACIVTDKAAADYVAAARAEANPADQRTIDDLVAVLDKSETGHELVKSARENGVAIVASRKLASLGVHAAYLSDYNVALVDPQNPAASLLYAAHELMHAKSFHDGNGMGPLRTLVNLSKGRDSDQTVDELLTEEAKAWGVMPKIAHELDDNGVDVGMKGMQGDADARMVGEIYDGAVGDGDRAVLKAVKDAVAATNSYQPMYAKMWLKSATCAENVETAARGPLPGAAAGALAGAVRVPAYPADGTHVHVVGKDGRSVSVFDVSGDRRRLDNPVDAAARGLRGDVYALDGEIMPKERWAASPKVANAPHAPQCHCPACAGQSPIEFAASLAAPR
jgi:hypothetical protein